ncbi:hypothetical protein IAT38_002905 [Cryptococcus sp. DSM 104549]
MTPTLLRLRPIIAQQLKPATHAHARRSIQTSVSAQSIMGDLAKKFKVHDIAVSGFGEGTNDLYDSARPSYPAEALTKIHDTVTFPRPDAPNPHPLKIVEPGAGTGIFSRLLLAPPTPAYPTFNIAKLIGVEPSEGMRNAWWRGLEKAGLGSRAEWEKGEGKAGTVEGGFDAVGGVEKFGVGKGEVDAVIIAQAFHWCPDYDAALREIASYLPPDAPLILIWNLEASLPTWQKTLRDTYEPFDLGTPQYYRGLWRKMFDTPAYSELFEPQEEWQTSWAVGLTEDGLVQRLLSKSYLTENHLKGEKREGLIRDLRKVMQGADHDWVDKENGVFKYAYNTDVVICKRKA